MCPVFSIHFEDVHFGCRSKQPAEKISAIKINKIFAKKANIPFKNKLF